MNNRVSCVVKCAWQSFCGTGVSPVLTPAVVAAVGCAFTASADIPASAYVQDGLVAQFDGIENAGAAENDELWLRVGTYDTNTTFVGTSVGAKISVPLTLKGGFTGAEGTSDARAVRTAVRFTSPARRSRLGDGRLNEKI